MIQFESYFQIWLKPPARYHFYNYIYTLHYHYLPNFIKSNKTCFPILNLLNLKILTWLSNSGLVFVQKHHNSRIQLRVVKFVGKLKWNFFHVSRIPSKKALRNRSHLPVLGYKYSKDFPIFSKICENEIQSFSLNMCWFWLDSIGHRCWENFLPGLCLADPGAWDLYDPEISIFSMWTKGSAFVGAGRVTGVTVRVQLKHGEKIYDKTPH